MNRRSSFFGFCKEGTSSRTTTSREGAADPDFDETFFTTADVLLFDVFFSVLERAVEELDPISHTIEMVAVCGTVWSSSVVVSNPFHRRKVD